MNDRKEIILNVNSIKDIDNISKTIKYINLDILNPNQDIINYFLNNGLEYSYSDIVDQKQGYIYIEYDIFNKGQIIINNICNSVPSNLNSLEKAKYLYLALGKMIGYDINILPDKNEMFDFYSLNTINNLWGSVVSGKGTNISFCKLYLYLCRLMDIECEVIMVNDFGYLCNKLVCDKETIIVDLTKDIPFIQSNFKTRYFGNHNDNRELDKKISYIKNNYKEEEIDKVLGKIDYSKEYFLEELLSKTESVLNISQIKSIELGVIYDYIFHKYCPNYKISINNLYINNLYKNKEHFILISYNDKHYSYNYTRNTFMEVLNKDIIKNIKDNRIGIYLNEEIPNLLSEENRVLN